VDPNADIADAIRSLFSVLFVLGVLLAIYALA
jgi:hypothetical protein